MYEAALYWENVTSRGIMAVCVGGVCKLADLCQYICGSFLNETFLLVIESPLNSSDCFVTSA